MGHNISQEPGGTKYNHSINWKSGGTWYELWENTHNGMASFYPPLHLSLKNRVWRWRQKKNWYRGWISQKSLLSNTHSRKHLTLFIPLKEYLLFSWLYVQDLICVSSLRTIRVLNRRSLGYFCCRICCFLWYKKEKYCEFLFFGL